MSKSLRLAVLLTGTSLLGLLACQARTIAEHDEAGACTRCHGGEQNQTGAPPRALSADGIPGAHAAHVEAGALAGALACSECHLDPREDASAHGNGKVDVVLGALAQTGGANPTYDRATGSCSSVYCHGGASGATAPRWSATDGAAAACGACHGTPGNPLPATHPALAPATATDLRGCSICHPATIGADGKILAAGGKHVNGAPDVRPEANHPDGWTSPTQHGAAAAKDVRACLACHAAKGEPHVTNVVCATCHDAVARGSDWTVTCNTCHGDATDPSGAPPADLSGNTATTARGVGAHRTHVAGSAIAPGFDCSFCHPKPATVLDPSHLDGQVELTGYTGTDEAWLAALKSSAFDSSSLSCGTSYCHGAFRNGNAANAPVWTRVGEGQADCGTCHGIPPAPPHPVTSDLTTCATCHEASIDASGVLIPPSSGGAHLDGVIEAGGHDETWMDPSSPGFHALAANSGLASCKRCHGQDLSGGPTQIACAQCHDGVARPAWNSCTMCHGSATNGTGAPPRATWGNDSPSDATNVRIGAHAKHTTASAIAPAFGCEVCHVKPQGALDPGHVDGGAAEVTFGGLATDGGTTPATWNRETATCTTYCHGSTMPPGGSNVAPTWTRVGQGQAACGTCHGLPPGAPHPAVSSDLTGCISCHGETVDGAGKVLPPSAGGLHMNGKVDGGHSLGWMDPSSNDFHALAANRGIESCKSCHGANLEGQGSAAGCASCHDGQSRPAWDSCTMCHGGTDNTSGAPPRATWGNRSVSGVANVRVGVHTTHVTGTANSPAIACSACHGPKPTSALTPGHISGGGLASVTFTGVAAQGTTPTWNRQTATCASTYCHAAGGSNQTPVWTKTGLTYGCASCHGKPPADSYHSNTHFGIDCSACHQGYTIGSANPATHVNGVKDVKNAATGAPWTAGWTDCGPCHSY